MDVNYGVAVKRYMLYHVTLLHVHRFLPEDVQFSDALVSSAVVVFQKTPPLPGHAVQFSLGGSLLGPASEKRVSLDNLATHQKWTNYPAAEEIPSAEQGVTLGDLFTIKRGLATGANRFFILPRDEAPRRGIPAQCTRPILPSPRFLSAPIIEADRDGYPRIDRPLSLIDCDQSEDAVRDRFPQFWAYLQSGERQGIHQGYLASRRSPWYSQEKREPAPFLCTYMGRGQNGRQPFRILWNKSAATAPNVYLLLYPKGALRTALVADPGLYAGVFAALQRIDMSRFVGVGRVYGGGLYKMEPHELARLPVSSASLQCFRASSQRSLFSL